jgi:molybdopterin-guanine dinucleotide biosynthesis protein A
MTCAGGGKSITAQETGGAVAGIVLTGGKSARMGRDKASLEWGGSTLARRTADLLARVCHPVIVAGIPVLHGQYGYPVIEDEPGASGPLAGVVAALRRSRAEWNVVVACDMPGLTQEFLADLIRRARNSDADCIVPVAPLGRMHPLCAAYRLPTLEPLAAALRDGTRKMRDALESIRCEQWAVDDARPLCNVNTPEDWREFLADAAVSGKESAYRRTPRPGKTVRP